MIETEIAEFHLWKEFRAQEVWLSIVWVINQSTEFTNDSW